MGNFCLRDMRSFEMRLGLEGIDEEVKAEFASHDGLRFGPVQISRLGAVVSLHLGQTDDIGRFSVRDVSPDFDWSSAPAGFPQQLMRSSALRVILQSGRS